MSPPNDNFIIYKEDEIYRLIISLIVLFLNLAEVYFIIYKWTAKKKRKTIYETYLLSLSFADVTFSLANMVFATMILANSGNLIIATIGYVLSLYLSVSHISAITVDRLIAIIFPLTHKLKVRVTHARKVILTLWVVCVAIGVVLYFAYRYNTFEKYTQISIRFIKFIIYVSDIIFIVAYIILCYILLRQENKLPASTRGTNTEKNILILCLLTSLVFVCCTLPVAIHFSLHFDWPAKLTYLLVANSGLNSLLYFFHGRFVHNYRKRLKTQRLQKTASASSSSTQ